MLKSFTNGVCMKKIIKNNFPILISFFATLFFYFIVVLINKKVYPFGDETIIYSDMFEQYTIYFNYIRDMIGSGESLFHSFSFSLGQNFYGILTYFCLSPLNFIFLLSTSSNLPFFIIIVTALKYGLSSLTMAVLLKHKSKNNLTIIIFSIIYGLMSYSLTYGTNIMWLDAVYLLPLIILGLENMLRSKPTLYLISLTLAIITNYYIAFSMCIFLVIYFIYYVLINNLNKEELKKYIFKFIKYSLIAVLLSMVVLLPTVFNMLEGKLDTAEADYSFGKLYNPFFLIYKFMVGDNKILLSDLPHITSSLLALISFILFFFNKKFQVKEKILTFLMILFLITITLIPFTNTIMHCFRLPNHFPYRYAFIISFFLILIGFKSYENKEHLNKKNLLIYIPFLLIIFSYLHLYIGFKTIVSSIFILIYLLTIIFNKNYSKLILIVFLCLETFINISTSLNEGARESYSNYHKLLNYRDQIENLKPSQNEFYRISGGTRVTYNDALNIGYYGVTSFSPTITANANKVLKGYLGLALDRSYAIEYLNQTSFTESFLGIKYVYFLKDDLIINENKNVFPVLFLNNKNSVFKEGNTKLESENNLYKYLSNSNTNLFETYNDYMIVDCTLNNLTLIKGKSSYCEFKAKEIEEGYNYYVELKPLNAIVPIYSFVETNEQYGANVIFNLKNAIIYVFFDETNFEYIKFYKMDLSKLEELKNDLSSKSLNITSHTQNSITGTIYNELDDQIMFTTIPYDDGWHVNIDGEEVKTFKNLDSLLAFDIPKGELNIELYFIPKGFIVGLILSLLTLDTLVVIYIRKSKED